MTIRSILVLIGLVAVFAFLIVWISKQGGWEKVGCGGDCAKCQNRCPDEGKKDEPKA